MSPESLTNTDVVLSPRGRARANVIIVLFAIAMISFVVVERWNEKSGGSGQASHSSSTTLSAQPSPALAAAALKTDQIDFEESLAAMIRTQGHVTVTVHVCLADKGDSGVPKLMGDGSNPRQNLYWGARYGLETFFANDGDWKRVFEDNGDHKQIIRRTIFQKQAIPTTAWQDRGVTAPFNVYILMNAWPSSEIAHAMQQPLRDALCEGVPTKISLAGGDLFFGSGSAMVGYVGRNYMLDHYFDPVAPLASCRPSRQMGVFYACPRSAVVLHAPIVERGLYSVLFARTAIIPEGYLVDGLMNALMEGDLGDGFMTHAANQYARYQKSISPKKAASMLFR